MNRCTCAECARLDRQPLQGIDDTFQLAFDFSPSDPVAKVKVPKSRAIYRIYFRRKQTWPADPPVLLVNGEAERDRILSRKTPIAVAWEKAKLYKCSCGRRGPWEKDWAWRADGGWKAITDKLPIEFSCPDCPKPGAHGFSLYWNPYEPLTSKDHSRRAQLGMTEYDRQAQIRKRRTVPLPEGWKGAGWCRWCLGMIEGRYRKNMNWHRDCKQTWMLHYDRDAQTDFLKERDGNDCWDCKRGGRWVRIDLVAPKYCWEGFPTNGPPVKIDWNDRYPPLAERRVDGVIVGLFTKVEYRRACGGLEVDHDTPLWKVWHLPDDERKPFYGPTNLRLRCSDCHKAKSKREAAERATLRTKGPVDLDA